MCFSSAERKVAVTPARLVSKKLSQGMICGSWTVANAEGALGH